MGNKTNEKVDELRLLVDTYINECDKRGIKPHILEFKDLDCSMEDNIMDQINSEIKESITRYNLG